MAQNIEKIGLTIEQFCEIKSELRTEFKMNCSLNCGDFDELYRAIINKTIKNIKENLNK